MALPHYMTAFEAAERFAVSRRLWKDAIPAL
jgi:hypothetical protein